MTAKTESTNLLIVVFNIGQSIPARSLVADQIAIGTGISITGRAMNIVAIEAGHASIRRHISRTTKGMTRTFAGIYSAILIRCDHPSAVIHTGGAELRMAIETESVVLSSEADF